MALNSNSLQGACAVGRDAPFWGNLEELLAKPWYDEARQVQALVFQAADINLDQLVGELRELLSEVGRVDLADFLVAQLDTFRLYPVRLRAALDRLTAAKTDRLFSEWMIRLNRSFDSLTLPEAPVLCGFSSNLDVTLLLDQTELNRFIDWTANQEGLSRMDFLTQARNRYDLGLKENKAKDLIDVVAFLISAFENPGSGGKVSLVTPQIRGQMKDYMDNVADQSCVVRQLGGGSGNAAWMLRNLGVSVHVHWAYHPKEIADACPDCLKRVVIEGSSVNVVSADIPDEDAPCQPSYILAFSAGLKIEADSQILAESRVDDRVIYSAAKHYLAKNWTRAYMLAPDGVRVEVNIDLGDDEWPMFSLFGSWEIIGDELIFRVADDAIMEKIAQNGYKLFIFGGLHKARDYLAEPKLTDFIRRELRRQLQVLKRKGVIIHTEFSGSMKPGLLDLFRAVMRRRAQSAGFNREELEGYTSLPGYRYFSFPAPSVWFEMPYQRYHRAVHFAENFNLDWLYVHSEDLNMAVSRLSPEELEKQRDAMLFAKLAVPKAIIERSLDEDTAKGWVQAVIPTIAEKGFISLLLFAFDYAEAEERAGRGRFQDIFESILFNGYHYRGESEYSVIAVPVIWPEMPGIANTAGAGDMSSAIVRTFTL